MTEDILTQTLLAEHGMDDWISEKGLARIIEDEVAITDGPDPDAWLTENLPPTSGSNYEYEF